MHFTANISCKLYNHLFIYFHGFCFICMNYLRKDYCSNLWTHCWYIFAVSICRDDLAKPASQLFMHNLTGIQESAVRATNAQYDDQDILDRLDVRLLEVSTCALAWVHVYWGQVHMHFACACGLKYNYTVLYCILVNSCSSPRWCIAWDWDV